MSRNCAEKNDVDFQILIVFASPRIPCRILPGGMPLIKTVRPKKMKFALSFICSIICVVFALGWALLMMYAIGMSRFGGNYPFGLFTKFWVVMPIILAIIGAVAVWLPLSTVVKTTLLGGLIVICLASSLIDDRTAFSVAYNQNVNGSMWTVKGKLPDILRGSIPLLFPFLTWTAEFMLSKKHKSSLTQANGGNTINYAIASLILSITGVIFWYLGSIPGIICGHIALKKYRSTVTQEGRGMAKAGIIIGWAILTYHLVPIIYFLIQAHQLNRT